MRYLIRMAMQSFHSKLIVRTVTFLSLVLLLPLSAGWAQATSGPSLSPRCVVPDSLGFDRETNDYYPNPFVCRVECVNRGSNPAYDVIGRIELAPGMEFDPPGQSPVLNFSPSTLHPWKSGDSIQDVRWTCRWTERHRVEKVPRVRYVVVGRDSNGVLLDSVDAVGQFSVPGLQPYFACDLELPDSLGLNREGTDVEPNPFTVKYTIRNISNQVGRIKQVTLYFPMSEGLSLSTSSPNPTTFNPNLELDMGEEHTWTWTINVDGRAKRRQPKIQVIAFDDEGNPIPCEDWLPIVGLEATLACDFHTDTPVLQYDSTTGTYHPDRFVFSAKFMNLGSVPLYNIETRIRWDDVSGEHLLELDSDYPNNGNPRFFGMLLPGRDTTCTWGLRLRNMNTTQTPQYIQFHLEAGSEETPYNREACDGYVQIDPVMPLAVHSNSTLPQTCALSVQPNPVRNTAYINLTLGRTGSVHLVVTDALGRIVHTVLDGEYLSSGKYTRSVQLTSVPAGLYFVRLAAGEDVRTEKLLLLR
ncbi:T9SS type A sorting domain-containing protein [bacterium]|nr:T9SS type A sorting domain-containing protein [bacterium]